MPYRSSSTATTPYDHLPGFGPMGTGILRALRVIPGVTGKIARNTAHVTSGPTWSGAARRADRAVTRVNRHLRRSDKKIGTRETVALPAGERTVLGTHRFCKTLVATVQPMVISGLHSSICRLYCLQKCNVLEYGNSTCNQITYRPVGRPGDLVETASPNTARERRPDLSYGQFCREEPMIVSGPQFFLNCSSANSARYSPL